MGAEPAVKLLMGPLGQEVDVEIAEHRSERVGIVHAPVAAVAVEGEAIVKASLAVREQRGEHARRVNALERHDLAAFRIDDPSMGCAGIEASDPQSLVGRPEAEPSKGITQPADRDGLADMRGKDRFLCSRDRRRRGLHYAVLSSRSARTPRTGVASHDGLLAAS
jgi:hypothetical protein